MRKTRPGAQVGDLPPDDDRPSLLTSQSTPSLPDLANCSLSATARSWSSQQRQDQHQNESATSRQHDQSQQSPPVLGTPSFEWGNTAQIRRNSFSSFLTKKYAYPRPASKPIKLPEDNPSVRKGHRPRSFSEIPPNLATAERAPPVAMTTKTPVYEYYGFVMYLVSFVALGIYLIWAYVPDEILHGLGITYYPKRYWALAIPIWLMTFIWLIFILFMCINLMNTAPFDSYYCITDEHANILDLTRSMHEELHDLPIGVVNAFLYQSPDQQQQLSKEQLMVRWKKARLDERDL